MASIYKRICNVTNGMHTSGANMLSVLADTIAEADGGDWTNEAHCIGKQKNSADKRQIAKIITATNGAVYVKSKTQPSGYALKPNTRIVAGSNSNADNRDVLASYVSEGVSFRNSLPDLLKTSVVSWVIAKVLKTFIQRALKEGYTFEAIRVEMDMALKLELDAAQSNEATPKAA